MRTARAAFRCSERVSIPSVVAIVRSAISNYSRNADAQFAAALAHRALFAIVPFVALLASVLGTVLPASAREDIVDWLLGALPGVELQASVNRELATSSTRSSVAGIVSFGLLMWSASGMTGSLRIALAMIWEGGSRTPFVRAKLRDVVALGVLATLVIAGFVLSLLTHVAIQAGVHATDGLGLHRAGALVSVVIELLGSGVVTFSALLVVYGLGPPVRLPFAVLWPSALVMTVAIDIGVAAYAFYLVRIASFSTIYGPLGAVLAFLALLSFVAILVLFGGELVIATSRARRGDLVLRG
jgi:membrane protein